MNPIMNFLTFSLRDVPEQAVMNISLSRLLVCAIGYLFQTLTRLWAKSQVANIPRMHPPHDSSQNLLACQASWAISEPKFV